VAELFAAILEAISPKSKPGKVIWSVIAGFVIVLGIFELLGALG
jgi:hypothetical protein